MSNKMIEMTIILVHIITRAWPLWYITDGRYMNTGQKNKKINSHLGYIYTNYVT